MKQANALNQEIELFKSSSVSIYTPQEEQGITYTTAPTFNPFGRNILCLRLSFNTDQAVTYTYKVNGKTPETDFIYTHNKFESGDFSIDMIGLLGNYTDGIWSLEFHYQNGQLAGTYNGSYDTSSFDYSEHLLHIDIEILDETIANSTINQGWLFSGYYHDAYDKNGDIRVCGLDDYSIANVNLKIHDNCIYVPFEYGDTLGYNKIWRKMKLTGEVIQTYTAPEGYLYHHDITWDEQGHFYALVTPETATEEDKVEGILYKYIETTGELIAKRDYSNIFYQSSVILNSPVNDCHLNSLEYIPETGQLLTNSRNCSAYFAIDPYSLLPIWSVDNPAQKLLLDDYRNLTVNNSEGNFTYPNGEHAVFVTHHKKYQAYRGNGRFVLTLFDNESCRDENGNDIEKLNEDATSENAGYAWDSAAQVVAVDLHKGTVTQLDRFTVPTERSHIVSSVFDSADKKHLEILFGIPGNFFVIDGDGKVGVAARNMCGVVPIAFPLCYRARIFTYDELHEVLWK